MKKYLCKTCAPFHLLSIQLIFITKAIIKELIPHNILLIHHFEWQSTFEWIWIPENYLCFGWIGPLCITHCVWNNKIGPIDRYYSNNHQENGWLLKEQTLWKQLVIPFYYIFCLWVMVCMKIPSIFGLWCLNGNLKKIGN